MKDFKLISEAEDSYHIEHDNGRKFTVDKKGLSPKAHDAIKKMAGGGSVNQITNPGNMLYQQNQQPQTNPGQQINKSPEEVIKQYQTIAATPGLKIPDVLKQQYDKAMQDQSAKAVAQQAGQKDAEVLANRQQAAQSGDLLAQPANESTADVGFADGGEVDEDDEPAEEASPEQNSVSNAVPTEAGAQVTADGISTMPQYNNSTDQNIKSKIEAVQNYQKEAGAASQDTQDIYNNVAQQMSPSFSGAEEHTADEVQQMTPQELAKRNPQQIQADGAAMDAKFMETLQKQSQSFDPMRYVHNMSTGSKILNGIAIALGGAGAGRGGTNQALEVVNRAINNDVEHQKADYSNTMNLYKMNHQATQDALQASLMTKNQLISVAQMQVAAQGARSSNAKDAMNGQMIMADLQQQKDRNNMVRGILSNRTPGPGGVLTANPEMVMRQVIQDPHQQAQAIEALHRNEDIENTRQTLNKTFNDISNMSGNGKLSPADREGALNSASLIAASKLKMKPAVVKEMLNGIFPGGGWTGAESEQTTANNRIRLNQMLDSQKVQMGPFKPSDFGSTSSNALTKMTPLEIKMHNIAQSHPNNAESIKFHNNMTKKYGTSF